MFSPSLQLPLQPSCRSFLPDLPPSFSSLFTPFISSRPPSSPFFPASLRNNPHFPFIISLAVFTFHHSLSSLLLLLHPIVLLTRHDYLSSVAVSSSSTYFSFHPPSVSYFISSISFNQPYDPSLLYHLFLSTTASFVFICPSSSSLYPISLLPSLNHSQSLSPFVPFHSLFPDFPPSQPLLTCPSFSPTCYPPPLKPNHGSSTSLTPSPFPPPSPFFFFSPTYRLLVTRPAGSWTKL